MLWAEARRAVVTAPLGNLATTIAIGVVASIVFNRFAQPWFPTRGHCSYLRCNRSGDRDQPCPAGLTLWFVVPPPNDNTRRDLTGNQPCGSGWRQQSRASQRRSPEGRRNAHRTKPSVDQVIVHGPPQH